jgi:flavin-dependent thymidylate synthase
MTESGKDIIKYGDDAMYDAQPMHQKDQQPGQIGVTPSVFLLSATPDPLGAIAAGMRMFRGDPVYSIDEITDEDRKWAWEESIKGHLKAPWEFVDFMFMIEGVTRAFTHQLVRQRTAVYAQESLRFAVKRGFASEVAVPPSVVGNENAESFWNQTVRAIEKAYEGLIHSGIPAEDARGLLPHCVTTRVIYKTNLRGLLEHAGNRLCTQAQFEWRSVFMGFMQAIREYESAPFAGYRNGWRIRDGWQFGVIGTPRAETFAPVCYHLNKCPFMSELDRGCSIRDRVLSLSSQGVQSKDWGDTSEAGVLQIDPVEWMANPMAGVTDDENNPRPE